MRAPELQIPGRGQRPDRHGPFRPLSRNYSVEPNQMNYRDTMNTEKTKHSPSDTGLPFGDLPEQTPALVFRCVHRASVVSSPVPTE